MGGSVKGTFVVSDELTIAAPGLGCNQEVATAVLWS